MGVSRVRRLHLVTMPNNCGPTPIFRSLFSLILLSEVVFSAPVARDLYDYEIQGLLKTAEGRLDDLEILHIEGSVLIDDERQIARAAVVYDMDQPSPYCMAPAIYFEAQGNQRELGDWEPVESVFRYRFWYVPCASADPRFAIELDHPISIPLLEIVRSQRANIVRDSINLLDRDDLVELSVESLFLRRIDTIRKDPDRYLFVFRFRDHNDQVLSVRSLYDNVDKHFLVVDSSVGRVR